MSYNQQCPNKLNLYKQNKTDKSSYKTLNDDDRDGTNILSSFGIGHGDPNRSNRKCCLTVCRSVVKGHDERTRVSVVET